MGPTRDPLLFNILSIVKVNDFIGQVPHNSTFNYEHAVKLLERGEQILRNGRYETFSRQECSIEANGARLQK